QELWAATSQDLDTVSPTMSFAPASPLHAPAQPMEMHAGAGTGYGIPPPPPPPTPRRAAISQPQVAYAEVPQMPVSGIPGMPMGGVPVAASVSGWSQVPNNLASDGVPETERALEVKTLWGTNTVIDTINVYDKLIVTMGDERRATGWGPFQKIVRCDIEVPS